MQDCHTTRTLSGGLEDTQSDKSAVCGNKRRQSPCSQQSSMHFIYVPVLCVVLSAPALARAATIAETLGDASIAHDSPSGTWTIAAGGAALTIEAESTRDFHIVSFVSPSGRSWITNGGPGTAVTVNGSTLTFGSRAAGFRYEAVSTSNDGHVLRLDLVFALPSAGLRVARHVAV